MTRENSLSNKRWFLGIVVLMICLVLTSCKMIQKNNEDWGGVEEKSTVTNEDQGGSTVDQDDRTVPQMRGEAYRTVEMVTYDRDGSVLLRFDHMRIKDDKGTQYIHLDDFEKFVDYSVVSVEKDDTNKRYSIQFLGASLIMTQDYFEYTVKKRYADSMVNDMSTYYSVETVNESQAGDKIIKITKNEAPYPLMMTDKDGTWVSLQTVLNMLGDSCVIDTVAQMHVVNRMNANLCLLANSGHIAKYPLSKEGKEVIYKEMLLALRKYYTYATLNKDAIDLISSDQAIEEMVELEDNAFYQMLEERFNSIEFTGHQYINRLGNQKSVNNEGMSQIPSGVYYPELGEREPSIKDLGDGWGYMVLTSFSDEAYPYSVNEFIVQGIHELHQCENIVIDIRHNGGGYLAAVSNLIESLSDKPLRLSYINNSAIMETIFTLKNPLTLNAYGANLYVVVDSLSASAANIFPSIIKDNDMGIIVGQKTGGLAAGVTAVSLSDGTILSMNTGTAILDQDKQSIELGIEPDTVLGEEEMRLPIEELIQRLRQQ